MRNLISNSLVVGGLIFGLTACGSFPTQKDPPLGELMNRQDVDVKSFQLNPDDPLAIMGVGLMWNKSSGKMPDGGRVIVAVLGTGIDYTNEDLRESLWINTGEIGDRSTNNNDDDGNGYADDTFGYDFYSGDGRPYDWFGHDTFTASVITATGRKNPKVVGVAPNASLMALRYMGPDGYGNGIDAALAIDYAVANGAKVVYLNWPNGGFRAVQGFESVIQTWPLVVQSIKDAAVRNVIVVIPAGNSSNQDVPEFLAEVAGLEHVLVVAGTLSDGQISKRSNYGKRLAATAAPLEGGFGYLPGGVVSNDIKTTSVAAAYAAGAAALIATMPGYGSASKIKKALLSEIVPNKKGESLDVLSQGVLSISKFK